MTINERTTLPFWKKIILLIVAFILFSIQLFLLFALFDFIYIFSNSGIKWVYIFTEILGIIMALYMLTKPICTNYKLTWVILFLLFPLPFTVLFFINEITKYISREKLKKKNKVYQPVFFINNDDKQLKIIDEEAYSFFKICNQDNNASVFKNTKFTFFADCYEKHKDMLEEIRKAKHYIFMEYFIIQDGLLMEELIALLEEKGKAGIEIKILYDDIGSKTVMTRKLLKKLSSIPNLKINNYEPSFLNLSILVNYRDHRKMTIIDGKVCYCGGDNLADEYIHKKIRFGHWRDNCGKFEGKATLGYLKLFCQMWYISTKEMIKDIYIPNDFEENDNYVITFGDGPINDKDIAYDLFMSLINNAKKSIKISTPYFIIDDAMINSIVLKIKEGIDVQILMPKIPDKKSVFYISQSNYQKILLAGGKIYEYTPGFNHAKNIIIDDKYVFIGTINMDYRSMFLHYECGSVIINNSEMKKIVNDFNESVNKSELIGYDKWCKRPIYKKIIPFILNLFSTLF